jgi:hypothetical protein
MKYEITATAIPKSKNEKRPANPGRTRSGSISGAGVSARNKIILFNMFSIYRNPANKSVSGVLVATRVMANS